MSSRTSQGHTMNQNPLNCTSDEVCRTSFSAPVDPYAIDMNNHLKAVASNSKNVIEIAYYGQHPEETPEIFETDQGAS